MVLKDIIESIDARKKQLDEYGPLSDDQLERLEQKIRIDWTYHSNALEGNQLTYGDTRSLLLYGLTAKGKPLRDHLDIEGHNEAIKKLESISRKKIRITESLIKEFHRLILAEPFNEYRQDIRPGNYKKVNNYLYNHRGERVNFCPPDEVPQRVNSLINWTYNAINPPKRSRKVYEIHPLIIATRFHLEFIDIHPFDDGNGRLARIFSNLILMQCGYPPYIVPTDMRDAYSQAIQIAHEEQIDVLAEFLGERLLESLNLYIRAAQGLPINEPTDLDKQIALLTQQLEARGALSYQDISSSLRGLLNNGLLEIATLADTLPHKLDAFFGKHDVKDLYHKTDSRDTIQPFLNAWSISTTIPQKLQALVIKLANPKTFLRTGTFQLPKYAPMANMTIEYRFHLQFEPTQYQVMFSLSWSEEANATHRTELANYKQAYAYTELPAVEDFSNQLNEAIRQVLDRIQQRISPPVQP